MYVVLSGNLVVSKAGKQVAVGRPGDCFGEMALIERRERAATLRALDDTLVLEIPEAVFREHLSGNPAALMALLRVFSERSRHDLDGLVSANLKLLAQAEEMDRKNRELTETRRQLEHRNRDLERHLRPRHAHPDRQPRALRRRAAPGVAPVRPRRVAPVARLLRHRLLQALQRHLRPPGRRRVPRARGPGHGRDAQPPRRPRGALRGRGVHRPARRHRGRGRAHAGRAHAGAGRVAAHRAPRLRASRPT